jgi:hypothetical protein
MSQNVAGKTNLLSSLIVRPMAKIQFNTKCINLNVNFIMEGFFSSYNWPDLIKNWVNFFYELGKRTGEMKKIFPKFCFLGKSIL